VAAVDLADPPSPAFDTRITAVGTRSRAKLVFGVGGMWRGAGDDRSTAELSGWSPRRARTGACPSRAP
jgi:hypothetical protein